MKQENDIPDKIMERIRKLIRLKKSTTSEGEANNAAILVNRLLREYNLSLLDINERQPEEKFQIRRSDRLSFKDTFGSYWKRDLLRVVEEPAEKVQLFVLHTDKKAAQLIRHPSEEVKRQAEEMYGVKLEGVAEIKNETETETEAGTATSKDKDNADANENASAGKKSRETQKPSAKTVKAATEKLDGEIKDINMEYDKAVREIRQKEDAGSRQSALRSAGANRDRQLAKAVGQFSESSTSGKKGYDMENIIKDLRKEGVKVENMQATEWNALLKGKSISSSAGSTTRKAATKSRALMLSKTPVGYTLKAIGTTNRMSRQASADM